MTDILITAPELAEMSSDCRIFDCRFSLADYQAGYRQYRDGHIPNAYHLDMEQDLAGTRSRFNGRHPLPNRAAFEGALRAAGVENTTEIVLYDDNRLAGAARAWWLLRFFGYHRARILDGGFFAWLALGAGIEREAPLRQSGSIVLREGNADMVCDYLMVSDVIASGLPRIVDSREPDRFAGLREPIDPVAGRIPGALNLPWTDVADEHGFARGIDHQVARWSSLSCDDDPIVYCGSGITASVNILSRELAGLSPAILYAGSWSEWCAHPDLPTARDQ